MLLEGKTLVVTGGNSGIGAAIVRSAAAQGANVVIDYVAHAEDTDALVAEVESLGGRAVGHHRQEGDDRVAQRRARHALPQRVDRAGDVDARGVRELDGDRALHVAAADVAVDAVEGRRRHPDADLPGTGLGHVHVLVAQDLRTAERPPQRALVHHRYETGCPLGDEELLPLQA